MSSYVFQCVGLTGGTTDNLDAMDPSAFTGKEVAITTVTPTTGQIKYYTHQAVNSGAVADGVNVVAPVVTSTWRWHILAPTGANNILIVEDQKPIGTDDGGSSSLTLQTRDLNTIVFGNIPAASLATNQIELPAGTYRFVASAPCYSGGHHQILLYNITDSAEAARGTSAYNLSGEQNESFLDTIATVTVTTTFELRHYIESATAGSGLGLAAGDGTEVYARMTIEQLG